MNCSVSYCGLLGELGSSPTSGDLGEELYNPMLVLAELPMGQLGPIMYARCAALCLSVSPLDYWVCTGYNPPTRVVSGGLLLG